MKKKKKNNSDFVMRSMWIIFTIMVYWLGYFLGYFMCYLKYIH